MAETTGLGGWFKSTAASLEGHVKEIRENSKLIAADVASNVKDLEKAGRKIQQSFSLGGNGVLAPGLEEVRVDVTFQQGSLGLNLDLESGQVIKITPGGQAEALGLRIEDRVVAVQGEALEGKGAFQEALKQKLAKLPRPVQMTFLRIQQVDRAKDSTRREPKEKAEKVDQELDARLQDMQAKLDAALKDTEAAREEGQSLAAELKLRKSWMAQEAEELEHLRAEAEELRLALEAANSDKEVQRLQTKCRTLEVEKVELEASFAQCKDALSQEELKSSEALVNLTGAKKKEAELQLNLDLLQRSLKDQEAAVAAGRDQQTQELQGTLTELQLSFQEVDVKKNALEEEVQRLQTKCRTLEVEKVELEARSAQSPNESIMVSELLLCEEVREAEAGSPQAVVLGKEQDEQEETEGLLSSADFTGRIQKLQAKVGELEAQNAVLKRSLSQRPIVYQFAPPDAGLEAQEEIEDEEAQVSSWGALEGGCRLCIRRLWRLWLLCRKQRCMTALEQQLRWFTRRLLEKPCLMWLFYFHLLVLWCIEIWRQAVLKPLPMDPALSLESAVQVHRPAPP